MTKISNTYSKNAEVILFFGDVRNLLPTISEGEVQLIVTSPPYNLGKEYEKRVELRDYISQQKEVIEGCVRTLNKSGSICWQVGNHIGKNGEVFPLDILFYPIFKELGLKLRNRIVWHFGHGLHASKRFSGRYETILWFTKSDDYYFNLDPVRVPQKYPNKKYYKGPNRGMPSCNPLGKNPGDAWDIPNVKNNHVEKTSHPCQFPVALVERLILSMTKKGDLVFDPFIGAGTTAVAAVRQGRRVIGADIIKKYINIAKKRVKLATEGKLKVRDALEVSNSIIQIRRRGHKR